MGLGGALFAFNRQNAIEAHHSHEQERQRALPERGANRPWNISSLIDIVRTAAGGFRGRQSQQNNVPSQLNRASVAQEPFWDMEGIDHFEDDLGEWLMGSVDIPDREPPFRASSAARAAARELYYKPAYTHPNKLTAGFTHDFAPPESSTTPGSSSPTVIVLDDDDAKLSTSATASSSSSTVVEASTTLVCARCLDPLFLSGSGGEDECTEEEKVKTRIWALRCGHMLDGKCVEELMRPAPPLPKLTAMDPKAELDTEGYVGNIEQAHVSGKGKGKSRGRQTPVRDGKGKGRAVDLAEPEASSHVEPARSTIEAEPVDNSIRSRLRPRHPPGSSNTAVTEPTPQAASPVHPVQPLPRRRQPASLHTSPSAATRIKGKGKGRARKPVIEAEHMWACPVAGCGLVHVSVRVDGIWKMDEEKGAIGVFV